MAGILGKDTDLFIRSAEKDETNAAGENNNDTKIDAKYEEIEKLENALNAAKFKRPNQLMKPNSFAEIETSLKIELYLSRDVQATYNSEIKAVWESVYLTEHEVGASETEEEESQKERMQNLISFKNTISKDLPKFLGAMTSYRNDRLKQEIKGIKNEHQNVTSVCSGTKTLVPEHAFPKTGKAIIMKLREHNPIWMTGNTNRNSLITLSEYSKKESQEKIKLNERKIALNNNSS